MREKSHAVVPKETQIEHAFIWVEKILKGAPQATKLSKRLLDELHPFSISQDLKQALGYHIQARESDEAAEGIAISL